MIVMTPAIRTGSTMARTAASVVEVRSLPLGETAEDVSRVAQRIRAGQAFLKVVAYPWGVELDVCEKEGGR